MEQAAAVNDILGSFIEVMEQSTSAENTVFIDKMYFKYDGEPSHDLSFVILVSGHYHGKICISLPLRTAISITDRLSSKIHTSFDQTAQREFLRFLRSFCKQVQEKLERKKQRFDLLKLKVVYGRKINVTSAQCDYPLCFNLQTQLGLIEVYLALDQRGKEL